jgi:cation transport ATPase
MRKFYQNLKENTFNRAAVASLLLADIILFVFLYLKMSDKKAYERVFTQALRYLPQNATGQLPPDFKFQIYQLMVQSLFLLLLMIGLFHLFIYSVWWLKKTTWSRAYIQIYTYVAAPGSFLAGAWALINVEMKASVVFLVIAIFYAFVAFGLSYFPHREQSKGAKKVP